MFTLVQLVRSCWARPSDEGNRLGERARGTVAARAGNVDTAYHGFTLYWQTLLGSIFSEGTQKKSQEQWSSSH